MKPSKAKQGLFWRLDIASGPAGKHITKEAEIHIWPGSSGKETREVQ